MYDDAWAGIHADDGAPRLEVRNKPGAGGTLGRAPCKDAMEGNCITRNKHEERLINRWNFFSAEKGASV